MNRPLSPVSFLIAASAATVVMLIGSALLPHDRYFRWQELETQEARKADWIYERLHYDDLRIDVALIGTSRTGGGVSGPDLEAGYCALTGRRIHVVNFGMPGTGRNLQYVIAKELTRTKKPALVLVEVNEMESRRQHKGFITIADASDILTAPLFPNLNYPQDFAGLPGRQVRLFFQTLFRRPHVTAKFDPGAYPGHDLDRTRDLLLIDGTLRTRMVFMTEGELDREIRRRGDGTAKIHLPSTLKPLEYRVPRIYLKKIEQLVSAEGGKVQYLFIPSYKQPAVSAELLKELGVTDPILDLGGDIAMQPEKWRDATHVNTIGAIEQTERLAAHLAKRDPVLSEEGCRTPL